MKIATDDFLNRLVQEELHAISWENKLFGLTSSIYSTKELARDFHPKSPFSAEKVFLPNRINRVLLIIIGLAFPILLLYTIATTKDVSSYTYFIAIPFLLLLVLGLRRIVTSKDLNYRIKLTQQMFQIADKQYNWQDIKETYIVFRPKQRGTQPFLVVGLNNGFIDRYDLTNLMGLSSTDKALASAIEHYGKERRLTERLQEHG